MGFAKTDYKAGVAPSDAMKDNAEAMYQMLKSCRKLMRKLGAVTPDDSDEKVELICAIKELEQAIEEN